MKIVEKIYDVETGKETITEREETQSEKDSRLEAEVQAVEYAAQAEANAATKDALLAKLGITADEAKLLLS